MHLFYTPDIQGNEYILSEDESKHCVRVLRLGVGSAIQLIDGKGGFYNAHITDADPRRTRLIIDQYTSEYGKRNHYLHIAIAPTKNIERIEWFLEKATELGIDEISLILCDRSERKDAKLVRLEKIVTSAVKQSLKAYHPKLNELIRFKDFIAKACDSTKLIAHCMEGEKRPISDFIQKEGSYTILIGPEGDFSPAELNQAISAGYHGITLGDARLRTETAALEACFEVNFIHR